MAGEGWRAYHRLRIGASRGPDCLSEAIMFRRLFVRLRRRKVAVAPFADFSDRRIVGALMTFTGPRR